MTSILLRVTGAHAWATVTGPLTSGMVGIPITIEYDAAWDGLTKNLVCRCSEWGADSAEQRTILNVGETAVVAHEVMKAGMYLYLGIEGRSADGTLVIPTTWARCAEIQYGANAGTEVSTDPTLPVWEQLQTQLGQLQQDVVTKEQMVGIMDSVQSATQAAAISAGRAEAAAKRAEEAAADHDSRIAPHIGANGNWFVGDTDTGVKAAGEDGYTPVKGVDYFTPAEVQEIAGIAAEMVDVPEGGGGSLQWHFVEEVITTEEVGWLALEIPEAAVEAALYVVVAASDSLTSSIRADAWKKAGPTMGGAEVTLGSVSTKSLKYFAKAAKYGEKIRNEQVVHMPYPTNAQVVHNGSDLHDPSGPYYIVSTPYGNSMIPIGTTIRLFVRY